MTSNHYKVIANVGAKHKRLRSFIIVAADVQEVLHKLRLISACEGSEPYSIELISSLGEIHV